MSRLCTVVFTGQLRPGVDPHQAAQDFAKTFKVPEDKARRLIEEGREKALKKEVDPQAAERYRDVLTEIGLEARIDPAQADPHSGQTCPKCGAQAVEQGICQACGVLVEAYLASQAAERHAEPNGAPAGLTMAKSNAPAVTAAERDHAADPQPRSVAVGQAIAWIGGGWALFKQTPMIWMGALLIFLGINLALAFVPFVGGLIGTLLGPVLIAGFMVGARKLDQGKGFALGDLFAGFSSNTGNLIAIGGLYLLGSIMLALITMALFIGPMISAAGGLDPNSLQTQSPEALIAALAPSISLMVLVILALMLPLIMAYWFAPALAMLDGLGPVAAMKLSFSGCVKNLVPFLVYGLIGLVLVGIGMIPLLLGLLIVSPLLIASMYVSYRDIFHGT